MMKLSEAILKGAKATKKAIGIRHTDEKSNTDKTCALGAAEWAIGKKYYWDAEAYWPELDKHYLNPQTKEAYSLNSVIADLNNGEDGRPWSRERIARWLAGIGL